MKHQTPIRMDPSEYFRRQCLISADPDESVTAQMVEHLGADYFIWASDYPHIDASFGVVRELKERLAPLAGGGAAQGPRRERPALLPAGGLTRAAQGAAERRADPRSGLTCPARSDTIGAISMSDLDPCSSTPALVHGGSP